METLKSYWSKFYLSRQAQLADKYPGLNEPIFMREITDLMQIPNRIVNLNDAAISIGAGRLDKIKDQFLQGVPFGYLLKFSEFFGNRFYIDERVLIPRPETEYLVEMLIDQRRKNGAPFRSVLDLGTGSGAILLSLLSNGFAEKGTGSDISKDALAVATLNAGHLRLNAEFIESDRFQEISGTFDCIVSNPPYIKVQSHAGGVHQSVDQHEPHLALYLKDEEYDAWFESFFTDVFGHLVKGGLFMMEGHEAELVAQSEMLQKIGFLEVKVIKDLSGRDRFLQAHKR